MARPSVLDRVGAPLVGHAFEVGRAAAGPFDARSDECVAHGLADENLSRFRESRYTRADVNRDAGEVIALMFDLTEVQAAAHVETELGCVGSDRPRDLDRDRRTRDHY